jgi:hypothetical protein
MRVRIDDPRHDAPALKVDPTRPRSAQICDLVIGAQRHDAPGMHRQGGYLAPVARHRRDAGVVNDEIGMDRHGGSPLGATPQAWVHEFVSGRWTTSGRRRSNRATSPEGESRQTMSTREVLFFASPLESEQVDRIRAAARDRIEIVHEPDLHPPLRYVADHNGVEGFTRTPEQEARWKAHLARATILWDFPEKTASGGGLAVAPKVRWVQTTSAGVGQMVFKLGLADSDLTVTTARGVHAEALAEFVFLALLMQVKDLARLQRDQKAHRWERYCCGELAGMTLAIIGAGRIGAQTARVAKAFGMRVIGTLANPSPARAAELGLDSVHGQGELLQVLIVRRTTQNISSFRSLSQRIVHPR